MRSTTNLRVIRSIDLPSMSASPRYGRSLVRLGPWPAKSFRRTCVEQRRARCFGGAVTETEVNEDFVDIVSSFVEEGVAFVVVGAYALAAHGFPRTTGDIDLFVEPSAVNAKRVFRALLAFGAPVMAHGVSEEDFAKSGNVYQLGLPPRRIDVLTSISGVSFSEAVEEAIEGKLGPITVRFIGRAAMRRNKLSAARPKDLLDAELLAEPKTEVDD